MPKEAVVCAGRARAWQDPDSNRGHHHRGKWPAPQAQTLRAEHARPLRTRWCGYTGRMVALKIVAVGSAVVAGLVSAADVQSGPPRQQPPGSGPYGRVPVLSIRAQPNPIVFGSTTTISGSLRLRRNTANVRVILQSRSFFPRGTFANVSATRTDRRGDYRFVTRPGVHTVYRVLTDTRPVRRSVDLLVRVRTRVGVRASRNLLRAGGLVRFTGRVFPRHAGRRAYVQRRSPRGSWVTVARPVLRAFDATSSRYNRRLRVRRTGVYRVKVNGHDDHSTGFSRLVRVVAR